MAELVLEQYEAPKPIPAGEILAAEVTFADAATHTYKVEEGPQPVVRFKFKITEPGEYEDRVLSADVNPWFATSGNCRLYAWILELLQEDQLPADFKFDTNMLVGVPCRIVISARNYKAKDGSDAVWNGVEDVIRASSDRQAF